MGLVDRGMSKMKHVISNVANFSKLPRVFLALSAILLALTQCTRADVGQLMENYLWEKRVLLIFSPSVKNRNFTEQNAML